MRNLFTVMKFTIREFVRKKSFIISTIIILSLVVLACALPKIISAVKGEDKKTTVMIVDNDNVFEGNLDLIKQINIDKYEIKIDNLQYEEIKKQIKDNKIHSAIVIGKDNEKISLTYIVENKIWESDLPQELFTALTSTYSNVQMTKMGITPEQLQALMPDFETKIEQTKEESIDGSNIFIMMALSFGLSMGIILFTAQVSTSITTEKTSKIMETLVTSTSPRTIVLGKTLGIGLVGLAQIALILITALVSAKLLIDPEILNNIINMQNITVGFVLITLVYFVLGFFAYALLYALTGSLVTKPEDIQSANTPISIVAMIGFYLGYFSISIDPTSSLASFAGYFPLSSAFCMPARMLMGLASWQDILISLGLLIVMVAVVAHVAIKVYSNAILNYGSKMSLSDALKMYKAK